jgi:hypothetical protein
MPRGNYSRGPFNLEKQPWHHRSTGGEVLLLIPPGQYSSIYELQLLRSRIQEEDDPPPRTPNPGPTICTKSNHQVKIGSSPCFSNGIRSIDAAASISRGPLSRSPVAHHPRWEGLRLCRTSFYYHG